MAWLPTCLDALQAQDYADFEVVVVDNRSEDGSADYVAEHHPHAHIIRNEYNLGFAGGNNVGIRATTGDIVALLNQDTVVSPNWLAALVSTFGDPEVGVAGCKSLYPDRQTIQHAGGKIGSADAYTLHFGQGEKDEGQYDSLGEVEYVTGAAMAIHRRVLDKIGLLDEGIYPAFYEDLDYCERARRAGFRIVYQPQAVLIHHETTSLPEASYPRVAAFHRNRVRFVLRHWAAEILTGSFVAREEEAIDKVVWLDDAVARARAYWDNSLALPQIASQRGQPGWLGPALSSQQVLQIADLLQDLRLRALEQANELIASSSPPVTPEILQVPELPELHRYASNANPTHIRDLKEELYALHNLPEHRFNSDTPVIGPLFAGFREAWLSIAARWYVWPIVEQQSTFNLRAVQSLEETAQQIEIIRQELTGIRKGDFELEELRTRQQRQIDALRQSLAEAWRELNIISGTLSAQQRIATEDDSAVADALRSIVGRLAVLEESMGVEGDSKVDADPSGREIDEA
jgi:GT2 family glycosyltransferase